MYEFIAEAYRAETGYMHDKNTTALDVVRYETEDLGNDIGIPNEILGILEARPANDVIWVTKIIRAAKRYGCPNKITLPPSSIVIGNDGEDGYLVLKHGLNPNDKSGK